MECGWVPQTSHRNIDMPGSLHMSLSFPQWLYIAIWWQVNTPRQVEVMLAIVSRYVGSTVLAITDDFFHNGPPMLMCQSIFYSQSIQECRVLSDDGKHAACLITCFPSGLRSLRECSIVLISHPKVHAPESENSSWRKRYILLLHCPST